jgi:hypothetical protein
MYTVKKRFRCFPFPRRDVTYQTLSRREYVSLIKPEVFPFPSWNSHRILLNQLVFLYTDRSFPGYSSSPGGNSSKIFDNSFVYLFPAWNFPVFSPFGQSSLIYINWVLVNYIHIYLVTIGPSQKHQFVYLSVHVYFVNFKKIMGRKACYI